MAPSHHRIRLVLLALATSMLMGVSTGCVHHHPVQPGHVHRPAPPPWAPAHGYRHHHDGVVLVFDSRIDCYTVVEYRDHYFYRDHYYRHRHGHWERGPRLAGPWVTVEVNVLPRGLHVVHADRHRHRDHLGPHPRRRHPDARPGPTAQRDPRRDFVRDRDRDRDRRGHASVHHQPKPRPDAAKPHPTRKPDAREARFEERKREAAKLHARKHREETKGARDPGNPLADRPRERIRDAVSVPSKKRAATQPQREKRRETAREQRRPREEEKAARAQRGRLSKPKARDQEKGQPADSGRARKRPKADRSEEGVREAKWAFRSRSPR